MWKRAIALALWVYFAWYLGALLAAFGGWPPSVIGPVAAVTMAGAAVVNWGHVHRSIQTAAHRKRAPAAP